MIGNRDLSDLNEGILICPECLSLRINGSQIITRNKFDKLAKFFLEELSGRCRLCALPSPLQEPLYPSQVRLPFSISSNKVVSDAHSTLKEVVVDVF